MYRQWRLMRFRAKFTIQALKKLVHGNTLSLPSFNFWFWVNWTWFFLHGFSMACLSFSCSNFWFWGQLNLVTVTVTMGAYFTYKDLCSNQWPQYYPGLICFACHASLFFVRISDSESIELDFCMVSAWHASLFLVRISDSESIELDLFCMSCLSFFCSYFWFWVNWTWFFLYGTPLCFLLWISGSESMNMSFSARPLHGMHDGMPLFFSFNFWFWVNWTWFFIWMIRYHDTAAHLHTYIWTYMHTYQNVYMWTFVHAHIWIHACPSYSIQAHMLCTHTHIHIYRNWLAATRIRIHTYIHTCMHTYTNGLAATPIHVHTYIHTCTLARIPGNLIKKSLHTHMHTYIHMHVKNRTCFWKSKNENPWYTYVCMYDTAIKCMYSHIHMIC